MRRALLLLLACCPIPDFVRPPGPPLIERFEVTPFELGPGDTATISWKVTGAARITLEGAGAPQEVEAEGSLAMTPERTTTIELIAEGDGGTSRARAEVRVVELIDVEIVRFEVAPTLVEPGDPVRVVWRTEHSTRVVIRLSSGETLIDRAPANGTLVFRPQRDVTVHLSAEGWPAPQSALRTVRARPDGPRIVRFEIQPPIANAGDDVGLIWEVLDAQRIRIFEEVGTSSTVLFDEEFASQTGFLSLVPSAGTHTYLLEGSSAIGTILESATAFILPPTPPEILSFTATPTITGPGGDVIVAWSTRFAGRVQLWSNIDFLLLDVLEAGQRIDRVQDQSLELELVVQDFNATIERQEFRTVVVSNDLPRIDFLSVGPEFVTPGGSAFISWDTSGADSITIATDYGEVLLTTAAAGGAFFEVIPTHDLNLVFTARNDRGVTLGYLPVRVLGPPVVNQFYADTLVARLGRPVTFSWTTSNADVAGFTFESPVLVPTNGSIRQYTSFLGVSDAVLTLISDFPVATSTSLSISVIEEALGNVEIEPNDTEPFAAGPYLTFPFSVAGSVAGSDVDLFELVPLLGDRIALDTTPPGGCVDGVALAVFELDQEIGLLGPRLEIDGPSICADVDAFSDPRIATLVPPIYVAVQRPTGTSTTASSPYVLSYSAQTGFCGDGVTDLLTDQCDDANRDDGDGCSASCTIEGLDEIEPNDGAPMPIAIEDQVGAFLGYEDIDRYQFEIEPSEAGARSIMLEAPNAGACLLDAQLILRGPSGAVIATDDNDGFGCPELSGPGTILTQGVYELEVRPGRGLAHPPVPRKGRYVFAVR